MLLTQSFIFQNLLSKSFYQFIMGQEAETLANIASIDTGNDYCIDLFKAISARTHISRLALYTRMYIDKKISYSNYSNVKNELAEEYRRREEQEKLKNSERADERSSSRYGIQQDRRSTVQSTKFSIKMPLL